LALLFGPNQAERRQASSILSDDVASITNNKTGSTIHSMMAVMVGMIWKIAVKRPVMTIIATFARAGI
jgi:hypothetical protein